MDAAGDYEGAEETRQRLQAMEEQLAGVEAREEETQALVPIISRLLLLVSAATAHLPLRGLYHQHPFLQSAGLLMEHVTTLEHGELRAQAVQALARYNVLDEGAAGIAFTQFVELIPGEEGEGGGEGVEAEVQLVAMKGAIDAALTYPSILLSDPPLYDPTRLAFRLFPYFDLDSQDVPGVADSSHWCVAIEGLCKLLLHDRLPTCSPEALERLTSFYYHWRPPKAQEGEDCGPSPLTLARAVFDRFRMRYIETDEGEASAAPHVHMLLVGLLMTMRRAAYVDTKHFPNVRLIGGSGMNAFIQGVGGDERRGREVQGQVVEELLAYASAFPHTRLIRALISMLDRGLRPRKGEVGWMRQSLAELKDRVSDKSAVKVMAKLLEAWRAVEEEEGATASADVGALEQRRAQRVAMWTAYDETADGIERDNAERVADKGGRRAPPRKWEPEEDEEEEEEVEEADVEDGEEVEEDDKAATTKASALRPVRQSRAVAERRMEEAKEKRREQDRAMREREREEQASSGDEGEGVAEDSSGSDSDGEKENSRVAAAAARRTHSRQPTMKGPVSGSGRERRQTEKTLRG